jgi:hypothetical protein
VKKLVVLSGGLVAVGSVALVGAGVAMSQPSASGSSYSVVGEPYQKALQILKKQGVKAYFGGSFGSVLPQAQCLVDQQKVTSAGRMLLMLDCTQAAADQAKEQGGGGPGTATVGGNGITTVTPTPVVPIQGAPGAGAAPGPALLPPG